MAINDVKISQLPALDDASVTDTANLVIEQEGTNNKITIKQITDRAKLVISDLPEILIGGLTDNSLFRLFENEDSKLTLSTLMAYIRSKFDATPLMTFDYVKVTGVVDIGEAFEDIATLAVDRVAGTYAIGVAFTSSLGDINDVVSFQLTGDITTGVWTKQAKSAGETIPWMYLFPYEHSGGPLTFTLQAHKGVGDGQFDIPYCDLIFDMKKKTL